MIERDFLQCHRIDGGSFDVLEVVAALTGKCEIVLRALPSGIERNDVLVREGSGRPGFLADAILAAEIRTFFD